MASHQDNVNVCNFDNNYLESIQNHVSHEWIPLALTTVEYPRGDWFGKFLALASLLPFSIISGFVALILFRRDLHTISFFVGTMLNELSNLILKNLIKEARPMARSTLYTEYGMPSSHSQFMWFFTIYIILFIFIKLQHMHGGKSSLETVWRGCLTAVCLSLATLVAYSRIYLQYHTWNQVLAGVLIGSLNAIIWFAISYLVLTPLYPTIASWRLSEFLLLRDTTLIPNVLWFEYTNSRHEARARARKVTSIKSQ